MRRLTVAVVVLASCGDAPVATDPLRYLADPSFRRAELVASLTVATNDYARLRLARYDTADAHDWSLLPAWNPPVAALSANPPMRALDLPPPDLAALRAFGALAFERYPAMLALTAAEAALRTPADFARYGFVVAADGAVPGLVRVALADGAAGLAYTCATCHRGRANDRTIVTGLANAALDLGALGADATPDMAADVRARLRAWGPGRVDVTTDDGTEPVAIPDLRPVRDELYLQRAGAVRNRSLVALAVRIETLLVTSHHEAVRPPREVALGLALYLDSLADALPSAPRDHPGEAVFAMRCASCHATPGYAGDLVAAETVGTDASLARSPTRGTNAYRVPSLRGVGARVMLLHDGSARGLDALLDPARTRGGHTVGVDLTGDERTSLRAFLGAL